MHEFAIALLSFQESTNVSFPKTLEDGKWDTAQHRLHVLHVWDKCVTEATGSTGRANWSKAEKLQEQLENERKVTIRAAIREVVPDLREIQFWGRNTARGTRPSKTPENPVHELALALAERDGVTGFGARVYGVRKILEAFRQASWENSPNEGTIQNWIVGTHQPSKGAKVVLRHIASRLEGA